jgi:hypothetical protein
MARLEQVKGRAIRVCSHADLPPKDRIVDIYTYVSVFSQEQFQEDLIAAAITSSQVNKGMDDEAITSDQSVLEVAKRKQKIIDNLLKVLQEVSVDCEMNYADNYTDQEPLTCFKYSVPNEQKDPFMFEPDLKTDILRTKTGVKTTQAEPANNTNRRLLRFIHKGKQYIRGPWKERSDKSLYASLYDATAINTSTPITTWVVIGEVDKVPDNTQNAQMGRITNSRDEGEEEEDGEEETATETTA